jgi:glycosyltransferase involved in cell wall biosynthesis
MKVLFVGSGNSDKDISIITYNQGESLRKAGVDLHYWTIKGKGLSGYFKSIFLLRKYIKQKCFNIIHAHYSLSAFVASLAGAKPLVVSLMGSDVKARRASQWLIKIFKKIFWQKTIVKSSEMKKSLNTDDSIEVIPNGVDFTFFREFDKQQAVKRVNFDKDKKNIIFISNPDRREKNYNLAKEAYKLLSLETVKLNVIYNADFNLIPHYMNAADVLILTSLWEGSPNVIKEAMACNCPIVSTDVGDVGEVIGKTEGCYITSFDPQDVADKLKEAMEFGKRTKGREAILHLDSQTIAKKIIKVYEQVLDSC